MVCARGALPHAAWAALTSALKAATRASNSAPSDPIRASNLGPHLSHMRWSSGADWRTTCRQYSMSGQTSAVDPLKPPLPCGRLYLYTRRGRPVRSLSSTSVSSNLDVVPT
eukprot:scaffold501_cov105-Isochrysis_galbana.AAC.2